MLKIFFSLSLIIVSLSLHAQRYITRTGHVSFYSHAPIEDIRAENNQLASAVDINTGEIVFQVTIKSFVFERALMQEHFNENYLESDKFPKSIFQGNIQNIDSVDFSKNGRYDITVAGNLTIHGVSRKVSAKGLMEITGDQINASAKFNIAPADYDIKIPSIVRENIAKTVEVSISVNYLPAPKNL